MSWRSLLHRLAVRTAPSLREDRRGPNDNQQRGAGEKISIPQQLTKHHGGTSDKARQIGQKWAETFELLGGLRPDQTILDVGCGPGRMAIAIGDRFDWQNVYTGFEIVKEDVRFCQKSITTAHPSFQFTHIDAYNVHYNPSGNIQPTEVRFPADDASIDFCFATSIFTHLFADESRHYIREASRVTRGTFLSTWFILDEAFGDTEQAGTARFAFPYSHPDGTRYENPKAIAAAVGHSWRAVEDFFAEVGLSCELHRGAWRGDKKGVRHSQDVVVARPL